jgi:hypothetical protein
MSEFKGCHSKVGNQPFRLRPPVFLCVVHCIHAESFAPNCFDVTAGVIVQNGGYFGVAAAFRLARKPRRMSRHIDTKKWETLLSDSADLGNLSWLEDAIGDAAVSRTNIECKNEFAWARVRLSGEHSSLCVER